MAEGDHCRERKVGWEGRVEASYRVMLAARWRAWVSTAPVRRKNREEKRRREKRCANQFPPQNTPHVLTGKFARSSARCMALKLFGVTLWAALNRADS